MSFPKWTRVEDGLPDEGSRCITLECYDYLERDGELCHGKRYSCSWIATRYYATSGRNRGKKRGPWGEQKKTKITHWIQVPPIICIHEYEEKPWPLVKNCIIEEMGDTGIQSKVNVCRRLKKMEQEEA